MERSRLRCCTNIGICATYDMSVAATDNELVVTCIDEWKELQAISWTGDVTNTTIAEDVGLVLAMTSDAADTTLFTKMAEQWTSTQEVLIPALHGQRKVPPFPM